MILARYHSLMGFFWGQGGDPSHDARFHWLIRVAHWRHQWLLPFWSRRCTGYWEALPRQDILLCTRRAFFFDRAGIRRRSLWFGPGICIVLASALTTDTSSFGVALYLYTASEIVHCFLASILFTLLTPLAYAVVNWPMRTSQSELDPLWSVAEGGIVVGKDLLWQPSFVKYWLIGGWHL